MLGFAPFALASHPFHTLILKSTLKRI